MESVLDPSRLTDVVIQKTLDFGNLTSMLERSETNPTTVFVNKLLDNEESKDTLKTAARATMMAMAMRQPDRALTVALATWAYFGYQLAQAQLAELPGEHS